MDDHVGDAGLLVIQTCAEDKTAISLVIIVEHHLLLLVLFGEPRPHVGCYNTHV